MAYIYQHIRLDKNEPFYIGIGSDNKGKYIRANKKQGRSFAWKDIAYKIPYKVHIIFENLSWEEACNKEKELIALYGRKDLGNGNLVNFTDGGEGQFGRKDSEETRRKKSKPKSELAKVNMKLYHLNNTDYSHLKGKSGVKKGTKQSKDQIEKRAKGNMKKIFCPNLNILFNSLTEAGNFFNKPTNYISKVVRSKNNKNRDGIILIKYE